MAIDAIYAHPHNFNRKRAAIRAANPRFHSISLAEILLTKPDQHNITTSLSTLYLPSPQANSTASITAFHCFTKFRVFCHPPLDRRPRDAEPTRNVGLSALERTKFGQFIQIDDFSRPTADVLFLTAVHQNRRIWLDCGESYHSEFKPHSALSSTRNVRVLRAAAEVAIAGIGEGFGIAGRDEELVGEDDFVDEADRVIREGAGDTGLKKSLSAFGMNVAEDVAGFRRESDAVGKAGEFHRGNGQQFRASSGSEGTRGDI